MELQFINEFQISKDTSTEINSLMKKCFPDIDYEGRDHFKQLPHYRILAKEKGKVIGQLGIDFRVMNLNGHAIRVFGVIDLCVDPQFQKRGIGKALLDELDRIAKNSSDKVDYLFLVADSPTYYERLGFRAMDLTTTWLKLDNFRNYGVGKEKITDAFFMVKEISDRRWVNGDLDLLGYMF